MLTVSKSTFVLKFFREVDFSFVARNEGVLLDRNGEVTNATFHPLPSPVPAKYNPPPVFSQFAEPQRQPPPVEPLHTCTPLYNPHSGHLCH